MMPGNQFDVEKFYSMMNNGLQNGGPNFQGYINSALNQAVISFLSSAFAPKQNTPPPAQPAAPPTAPSAQPGMFGMPGMQNLLMQMIQMMLFPPKV